MANVRKIIDAHLSQRQRQLNQEAERAETQNEDRLLCNIIRVAGNIDVPSRPGFVWCQEYSPSNDTSPFHAFNSRVQAREGLVVWVGAGLGGRREVLDWNNGSIVSTADYASQKYLPKHRSDHQWPDFKPGPDAINVYPRSLTMLRAYPGEAGALTVSVAPLRYIKDGAIVVFPGTNSLDISASQPASGLARFVGIYLDWDDNTVKSVNGATTSDSPAITPDSPTFPDSAILSATVRLDGDQTAFSEVDFVDARQVLSFTGPGAVQVSEVWESDFGAVALQADATGQIGIGTATPTYELDVVGNIGLDEFLYHNDDPDTYLQWTDNQLDLYVGGVNILRADETTQDVLYLGDVGGAGDVDIDFNNGQMFIEGSTGFVGINKTTSLQSPFHIDANDAICERLTRLSTTDTNQNRAMAIYLLQTTQATADGLGPNFTFNIEGSDGAGTIATFSARRDTARNEGTIGLKAGTNGVEEILTIQYNNKVGINQTTPVTRLDVYNTSAASVQPVALFSQADVDEPFLKFVGTSTAANLNRSLVDNADVATATLVGWWRIEIDDVTNTLTDGDYFTPFYTLA